MSRLDRVSNEVVRARTGVRRELANRVLFRCKQYFNAAQLFKLYTGFIRPCLEYCSHI